MGEPLSVAAGVIGVATAAVQVSKYLIDFMRRVKNVPIQAATVLNEVNDIHAILEELRPFLLGLDIPNQSRTCLLRVDSVLAVLTSCVETFSELEELMDQLRVEDLGLLGRSKWVSKKPVIAALISRLQANKISLSLMLNILNG